MAEQITGIEQVAYSRETTWNSETTHTASSGTTTTMVSADLTDAPVNKFRGAMFYCVNDDDAATNDGLWRKCDGFDPANNRARFDGDAWAAAIANADTFKHYFIPRFSECSLSRDLKFGDRSGYKRESLYKKFNDPYIRGEAGISLTAELTGMGHKATYGEASGSAAGQPIAMTAGHESRFAVGQPILIRTTGAAAMGADEWTVITSINTTAHTLTVSPVTANAAVNLDAVYGLSMPGELGVLLSGALGSVLQAGRGGEVAAAPAPAATGFTVTDGTQFAVGGIIGVGLTTGVEWTQVTSIATNAITVSPELSTAPVAADIVYNSWTCGPADTGHESYTFNLYKHGILYTVNGCKSTVSIEGIETDALPQAKFEILGGSTDARADGTLPSDWDDAYSAVTPPVPVGYYLQIAPAKANTASKEFSDASFELGSDLSRRYSPTATAGVANVSVTGWKAPVIKAKLNKEALSTLNPFTAATAGTLQRVRLILGTTPGATIVIDLRQAQTLVVNEAENDGRDYWEVEFHAKDDASSTVPPFVVALC